MNTDNTVDFDREAVLRRISKLLAIAGDDRADPNEAAAAASQAAKIMRKYQFENADVLSARLEKGEDLAKSATVVTAKTNGTKVERAPTWACWIAYEIAQLNDCQYNIGYVQGPKGYEAAIQFMGYRGDVEVSKYMLEYLAATVNRLCVAYRDSLQYKIGGRSTMDSYRKGVAIGIMAKLRAALAARKAEEAASAVTGRGLMVVKAQAIEKHFGAVKYRKTTTVTKDGRAMNQGVQDGKAVDVNRRGVGHTANPQRVLN